MIITIPTEISAIEVKTGTLPQYLKNKFNEVISKGFTDNLLSTFSYDSITFDPPKLHAKGWFSCSNVSGKMQYLNQNGEVMPIDYYQQRATLILKGTSYSVSPALAESDRITSHSITLLFEGPIGGEVSEN